MTRKLLTVLLCAVNIYVHAQPTFKAGWNTYKTASLLHEYTYTYVYKDSAKFYLTDSAITCITADSLVTMTTNFSTHDKAVYKTVNFFNKKKCLVRSEEYKGDNMQSLNEWRYDDKNRKIYHSEDNKQNGNNYKSNYEYTTEKNGDVVIMESAYFNGKIEFYTRSYYNRSNVKYKEVRLNDNNKDIIHIESYIYGENGKVKERTVYFPEFKVTKKFDEREGYGLPKCERCFPMGTVEKVNLRTRISFMKKLMTRIQPILSDKDCDEFEYTFSNGTNCDITLKTTKVNNIKQLVFRYKEKI